MTKKEKGKSHSTRPVTKRTPGWCRYTTEEVEAIIIQLAKEGHSSSMVGTILRDRYGIPLAKPITGKKISRILKEAKIQPAIPEDLDSLIRKASQLRLHLDKNRKDLHNKRALQTLESRIRKLSKYYVKERILPSNWRYKPKTTMTS